MKSEKRTRLIKPRAGSAATARKGLQSLTIHVPESDDEWEEASTQADDVRFHLAKIIEQADKRLHNFPGAREAYQVMPDGSWISREEDVTNGKTGFSWRRGYSAGSDMLGTGPSLPIEPASPVYFAWVARDAALTAIDALGRGDMERAVSEAMNAVDNWWRMGFGEEHEPMIVAARGSAKGRSGHQKKPWADAVADLLIQNHPKVAGTKLVYMLPDDGELRVDSYTIWRNGGSIYANHGDSSTETPMTMTLESFRTGYIVPRKKSQKQKGK